MKLALLDCGSSRFPAIQKQVQICGYAATSILLCHAESEQLNTYDALIISGGPHLYSEPAQEKALRQAFDFLVRVHIPVLGICLGHQALGIQAGASVYRGEERRTTEEVSLSVDHPLFQGYEVRTSFSTDHCEGISTPDSYKVIASSHYYPVEAIADDSSLRFGVQFHPESDGDHGNILFKNFFSLIGGKKVGCSTDIIS